jgi:hypothetical protein
MTASQVLELIKSYIYNNDIKNPENHEVGFTGSDLARGMERFAWICKQCEAEDSLVTKGNNISCNACSASWRVDAYMNLEPRMPGIANTGDFHDWIGWHKNHVKNRLAKARPDSEITRSADVTMQKRDVDGIFKTQCGGDLMLTSEKIIFLPESGESGALEWSLGEVEDYVIQLKDIFEFRVEDEYFRFVFDEHSPMKWIFYLRYMKGYEKIEKRGHY